MGQARGAGRRIVFSRKINFRVSAVEDARLAELCQQTGMVESEVMRSLIANATVGPVTTLRPVSHLIINDGQPST